MVVVDVGQRIELYSEFSRSGGTYVPFPDPRSHRIALADLRRPELRERLRRVWTDPLGLVLTRGGRHSWWRITIRLCRRRFAARLNSGVMRITQMPSATIKVYLPHGDPKRLRTGEISNWSGKAVATPCPWLGGGGGADTPA